MNTSLRKKEVDVLARDAGFTVAGSCEIHSSDVIS
jgi:hypothetical protein